MGLGPGPDVFKLTKQSQSGTKLEPKWNHINEIGTKLEPDWKQTGSV